MTFSSKTKRVGYGENLRGVIDKNGDFVFAYTGRDKIVRVKKIFKDGKSYSSKIVAEVGGKLAEPFEDGQVLRVQDTKTIGVMKLEY